MDPWTVLSLRVATGDLVAVCTELEEYPQVGAADIDGDGIADAVALLGPAEGPSRNLVLWAAQGVLATDLPTGDGSRAASFPGARDVERGSGRDVPLTVPGDEDGDLELSLRVRDGEIVVLDAAAG